MVSRVRDLFDHCTHDHINEKFSIRRRMLDDRNGEFIFKSLHFPINVVDIVNRLKQCHKCIIDAFLLLNNVVNMKCNMNLNNKQNIKLHIYIYKYAIKCFVCC